MNVNQMEPFAAFCSNGIRVNSIFGEGVSPKFRKIRQGLDILGWPSNELLRHRRERIVYGVGLADNLRDYLIGLDPDPKFIFDVHCSDDIDRLSQWWRDRWLEPRIRRPGVLSSVRLHKIDRPVQHGARVLLPPAPDDDPVLPGLGR